VGAALVLAVAALGCGSDRAPAPERAASTEAGGGISTESASAEATAGSSSSFAEQPVPPSEPEPLEVEGHNPASHVGPDDRSSWPRPVVIVLHGNFDRPEWECETWSAVAGFHGWILCPRGIRTPWATLEDDRWTYRGSVATAEEIEKALSALEALYPGRVSREATVLVGFSLGANLAPAIVRDNPGVYPYVVLAEGGGKNMERKWIAAMKKAGVEGVGLAMSLPHLRNKALKAVPRFERTGIRVVFVDMKGAGHGYRDDFPVTGRRALEQLLRPEPEADAGVDGGGG
jgi:dienelactone hydrolase